MIAHVTRLQKEHQQKEPTCLAKGKAQEKRLRRTKKEEVVCMAEP